MPFFFIQLIASSLFATLAVAEQKWPGSSEYYGYRGPPAPLSSDGRVMETPEVAHARAAHLATHAEVMASMGNLPRHQVWEEPDDNAANNYEERVYEMGQPYQGPLAPLGHDGRVVDTAEVAQAKAAHLAAHAQAAAKASLDYDYHDLHNGVWDDRGYQNLYVHNHQPVGAAYVHHHSPAVYRGPPAPLAPDGRVLETPEVANAKEAHLRAHAYAAALAAHREAELYH